LNKLVSGSLIKIISLTFAANVTSMKSYINKVLFTLAIITLTAYNSFALNAADSDMSNSAGSNAGKEHLGMYIFICLFLVLAAFGPRIDRASKK